MDTFFRSAGHGFEPTPFTRGPWNENFQHGGPPSGLLLRAMNRAAPEGFALARVTFEMLRPVPLVSLYVEVDAPVGGRSAQWIHARLNAGGKVLTEATGLYLVEDHELEQPTARRPGAAEPEWPAPERRKRFVFPFFRWDEGYHQAVDVRVMDPPWGTTPVRCWARPLVALVDDEEPGPEEAVVILADAESGMGPPLDVRTHTFVNPDLTVYFGRRPAPGWTGLHIMSRADGPGIAFSDTQLRDAAGPFGRCAQAMVVRAR